MDLCGAGTLGAFLLHVRHPCGPSTRPPQEVKHTPCTKNRQTLVPDGGLRAASSRLPGESERAGAAAGAPALIVTLRPSCSNSSDAAARARDHIAYASASVIRSPAKDLKNESCVMA